MTRAAFLLRFFPSITLIFYLLLWFYFSYTSPHGVPIFWSGLVILVAAIYARRALTKADFYFTRVLCIISTIATPFLVYITMNAEGFSYTNSTIINSTIFITLVVAFICYPGIVANASFLYAATGEVVATRKQKQEIKRQQEIVKNAFTPK